MKKIETSPAPANCGSVLRMALPTFSIRANASIRPSFWLEQMMQAIENIAARDITDGCDRRA
jgi:hypothetical protein